MQATFEHVATGQHAHVTVDHGVVTIETPTLMGVSTLSFAGSYDEAIVEMAALIKNQYELLSLTLS